jgi:uncharacterized peroxidase-related enzyme
MGFTTTEFKMSQRIIRFPVPEFSALPDDIQERILFIQKRLGFVPNGFLAMANRPDELRAFFAYHEAVMSKPSGLTAGEKEMIVVVTSAAANCLMCVVAHGAVLRLLEKNPTISDQLAVDWTKADLSNRQRAMLSFALKASQHAHTVTDADVDTLLAEGYSIEDVWDIGAIAAFFALSNRMAGLLDLRPNTEYYALGRTKAHDRSAAM